MSEALLEALKKGALLVFNPRRDSPVESSFHPVDPSIYLTALGEEMEFMQKLAHEGKVAQGLLVAKRNAGK